MFIRFYISVIAKLTDESFEPDANKDDKKEDKDMAIEPIASDSDDEGSNLSNISSEDELAVTNHSTPSINNTLADLYKTNNTSTSQ